MKIAALLNQDDRVYDSFDDILQKSNAIKCISNQTKISEINFELLKEYSVRDQQQSDIANLYFSSF